MNGSCPHSLRACVACEVAEKEVEAREALAADPEALDFDALWARGLSEAVPLGEECSVCRRTHGLEIIHPCE